MLGPKLPENIQNKAWFPFGLLVPFVARLGFFLLVLAFPAHCFLLLFVVFAAFHCFSLPVIALSGFSLLLISTTFP